MAGLTEEETLYSKIGHVSDMINCLALYNGTARKKRASTWNIDDALALE